MIKVKRYAKILIHSEVDPHSDDRTLIEAAIEELHAALRTGSGETKVKPGEYRVERTIGEDEGDCE